jgi:ribosomal protein S13
LKYINTALKKHNFENIEKLYNNCFLGIYKKLNINSDKKIDELKEQLLKELNQEIYSFKKSSKISSIRKRMYSSLLDKFGKKIKIKKSIDAWSNTEEIAYVFDVNIKDLL